MLHHGNTNIVSETIDNKSSNIFFFFSGATGLNREIIRVGSIIRLG